VTTPADLTRKVRQLDNDVQSIYEMLTRIDATQQRHGHRLDEVAGRLDEVAGRLDEVAGRLDEVASVQVDQGSKLDRIIELLAPGNESGE
jgi:methyl-accepting chemotaxis protein